MDRWIRRAAGNVQPYRTEQKVYDEADVTLIFQSGRLNASGKELVNTLVKVGKIVSIVRTDGPSNEKAVREMQREMRLHTVYAEFSET